MLYNYIMTSRSEIFRHRDHIYYNAVFTNDGGNGTIPIRFADSQAQQLLDGNPEDYELQIERFQIPMDDVPLFVWPKTAASPENGNVYRGIPDNTKFSLSLTVGGITQTQDVVYISLNTVVGTVPPVEDLRVFSVQHFIDIINNAFRACGNKFGPALSEVPYLQFDQTRNTIDLFASPIYEFDTITNNQVRMNAQLYAFFDNFLADFNKIANPTHPFRILVKESGDNYVVNARSPRLLNGFYCCSPPQADRINTKGYFSSLGYVNSIRSVLFTTSTIPVRNEVLPSNEKGDTSRAQLNILTDFVFDLEGDNAVNSRAIQVYNNTGDERYIDLFGTGGLNYIDIQAYWQDDKGRITPINIDVGKTFTMKILFRRTHK